MILYLIKNNFKLIFRNKWAVLVMLVGPILTIAMLSSAFRSLMSSYEVPDEFTVGYRDNGSVISANIDTIKEAGKEAGIIFSEYPEGDPEGLIQKNDLSAFVEFNKDEYDLYKSGDHKTECSITEYFIDRVMSKGVDAAIDTMAPAGGMTSEIPVTQLEFMPAIDSTDYYGIIYIVYFFSLGIICATGMLSSEKKNGIEKKFRICSLSAVQIYLARLIPTAAVVMCCALAETLLSVMMFDIHWGVPLVSAAVVVLVILAGCTFGFLLYSISRNMALTVIALFSTIWTMGFLGGSFETYMFSDIAENVKRISPFYFANRSLVELSCMGHSDYVISTFIRLGAITVICAVLTIFTDMIRKRGKA